MRGLRRFRSRGCSLAFKKMCRPPPPHTTPHSTTHHTRPPASWPPHGRWRPPAQTRGAWGRRGRRGRRSRRPGRPPRRTRWTGCAAFGWAWREGGRVCELSGGGKRQTPQVCHGPAGRERRECEDAGAAPAKNMTLFARARQTTSFRRRRRVIDSRAPPCRLPAACTRPRHPPRHGVDTRPAQSGTPPTPSTAAHTRPVDRMRRRAPRRLPGRRSRHASPRQRLHRLAVCDDL